MDRRVTRAVLAAGLLAGAASVMSAVEDEKSLDRFRKVLDPLVTAVTAGDYAAIRRDFNDAMAKALPLKDTTEFFKALTAQQGSIKKLGAGRIAGGSTAIFPAEFEKGPRLDIKVTLDAQGKIAGLLFVPAAPDIPAPKQNSVALRLPFNGPWMVYWGGDTPEQNQHWGTPNQQHAFDFLVVDGLGASRKGEGLKNEDYYAFGKEVLAPADGVVTDVISGVRDNTPGSMNPYSALGNAIVIQHREFEVSILAHLKMDSIRVRVGQKLKAGEILGLCGNSGNSSEPHLHYHLQNTPIVQDGTGVKCYFENVAIRKDGKPLPGARLSPVKGDVIEAAAPASQPASEPAMK
jgi:murein DD-endopeptidase MepM/ murein hydrolase activator NlpD